VREALPTDLSGIVIELTEHELFSTEAALDRELDELRARGARIALDDAGNGYAGLQQIIRVAPDILKLDRSLVDGVHDDPHRFALLEALISFASTTRAAVCAEGVETLDDLAVLASMDVTYAQGWALARPDAPWALLVPQAAAAASAEVRIGMRIAREPHDDSKPSLGDLIARLTAVTCSDDVRDAAVLIPGVLGADDAAVSRVVPGEDCLEDISRHGWSVPGQRYQLSEYPATEYVLRTRTAGQVVVGDPASDPAEVAVLASAGHQAVLMVPLVFGGQDVGLLELYRRHAMPWNSGEIERAQLLAHQLAAVLELVGREFKPRSA
jgi:GAF domain-containing protein